MPFDALPEGLVSDIVKLRMARDGIAGGWQKGALGLEDDTRHCVIGWLLEAADWDAREATRLLVNYVYPALPEKAKAAAKDRVRAVYTFNDGRHSKRPLIQLLDAAIKLAEPV